MAFYGAWKPYVPVAKRRAKAEAAFRKASKRGGAAGAMQPVRLDGKKIAHSFWGQGWCRHLEGFADFENRLPRGRTYLRSNAVWHLDVQRGRVDAKVMGSSLYTVAVDIRPLPAGAWTALKDRCAGAIGSLLELLQGRLSDQVMRTVTDRDSGLFPKPREMTFSCSCPDWADMCKHVAATLYGVGSRLDQQPELLFLLRGVDAQDLIGAGIPVPATSPGADRIADAELGSIFGIELDPGPAASVPIPAATRTLRAPAAKRASASRPFAATGKSVRALRLEHGLSVDEFAERLAVSPASVLRWEAAKGTLKLHARCLAALGALQSTSKMS